MNVRKDQIALLGTSADPPTDGHKALLIGLSKIFPKVITWASDNPAKDHGASLHQRSQFLEVLVKEIGIKNIVIDQTISSPWTIQSIEKAQKQWPSSQLILIIGSDLIMQLPHWLQAKTLLNKTRIGIAPRKGWPIQSTAIKSLEAMGAEIILLSLHVPESASSSVRNQNETTNIPQSILSIIKQKQLYGFTTKAS